MSERDLQERSAIGTTSEVPGLLWHMAGFEVTRMAGFGLTLEGRRRRLWNLEMALVGARIWLGACY
jgi:hypothetical protein